MFSFSSVEARGREVHLRYRSDAGEFEEILEFPIELSPSPALQAALRDLHVMAGVSYWKASMEAFAEPLWDADFWRATWTQGLGELFFRNGIDPVVPFIGGGEAPAPVDSPPLGDRVLLLVGGGKDSVVAREVLRGGGVPVDLVSLGTAPWIERSAQAMGDRHLVIRRRLSPRLLELNAAGAPNGHVPISAIIAFATRVLAIAGGWRAVISANERSASFGNTTWRGVEINHQFSKGLAFERSFQAKVAQGVRGGPIYFSLLRPLSELQICSIFARHPRYFDAVTSCNANFRIVDRGPVQRWCGQCPKCVFVQAMMAPFLDKAGMTAIFGDRDFLSDPANASLIRELRGEEGIKPFECVGTPEEVVAALDREPAAWAEAMRPSPESAMPPEFRRILDAAL